MSRMKPLEAYRVISMAFNELMAFRGFYYKGTKGYSGEEITAQVMAFEALRRMQEGESEELLKSWAEE